MLYQRLFHAPEEESFFLFGPRGTGKTTWLKQQYADALWVDLLDPREERSFAMHPELLRERLEANPASKQAVLDEVQKVPRILDVVHGLIEEKKGVQFILKLCPFFSIEARIGSRKREFYAYQLHNSSLISIPIPFCLNEMKLSLPTMR